MVGLINQFTGKCIFMARCANAPPNLTSPGCDNVLKSKYERLSALLLLL
jgi:hypothetical protein